MPVAELHNNGLFRDLDGRPGRAGMGMERKAGGRLVEVSPADVTLGIADWVNPPYGQPHDLKLTFNQKVILAALAGWSLEMLDQRRDPWFEVKQAAQFVREGITFELPVEEEIQRTLSTLVDPGNLLEYKLQKNTLGKQVVFYRIRSAPYSLLEAVKTSQDHASVRVDFFAGWLRRHSAEINPSTDLVNDWELEIIREIQKQEEFISGKKALDLGLVTQNSGLSREDVLEILKDLNNKRPWFITLQGMRIFRKRPASEQMQQIVDSIDPIRLRIVTIGSEKSLVDTGAATITNLGKSWRECETTLVKRLPDDIDELEAAVELLASNQFDYREIRSISNALIYRGKIPDIGLEQAEELYLLDKLSIGPDELKFLLDTHGRSLLICIYNLEKKPVISEADKKLLLKLKKGLLQLMGSENLSDEDVQMTRYSRILEDARVKIKGQSDRHQADDLP